MSIEKAKEVAYKNTLEFADFCAKAYPVEARFVKGDDIVIRDTTLIKGDSVQCDDGTKVKCPDIEKVQIERVRIDTVYQENTAYKTVTIQTHVRNELLEKENKSLKAKLNKLYAFLASIVVIFALLYSKK